MRSSVEGRILGDVPVRCMHGGSGTGKYQAIKITKHDLFEIVLHWCGSRIVFLHVVMTDVLESDTIYHDLGIQASGKQR